MRTKVLFYLQSFFAKYNKYFQIAELLCVLGVLAWLAPTLPDGVDWHDYFRPAALAMVRGESPYAVAGFFNAPWLLWPLVPFALMPYTIGRLGILLVSISAFTVMLRRLGAKPFAMIIFFLSSPVFGCIYNGNVDWLPLLGLITPPGIGLILLASKPQAGIGLCAWIFLTTWREKGWREVLRIFAPLMLLTGWSFWRYGLWPLHFGSALTAPHVNNTSVWPFGIFIGLVLFVYALRVGNRRAALASSNFISPYVGALSWSASLVGLLDTPLELTAAAIGLWIPMLMRIFL